MTYYETLGVSDTATAEEIKRAYRKLASQHHPDKGGNTKKFQEIQTAYDTISDNEKRQQYDMQRNGFGGQSFHQNPHHDINDIFKNFGFSFSTGNGDPFSGFRQQRRNKDLRVEIQIPLVTTLENQIKTISVQTTNGHRETVQVNVPRGIPNGSNIKYPGLGDNMFNTIPRGDLYVQIHVVNPEGFLINNIDLYTKIRVNCLLAITGGPTIVTGLDGKEFELTIPAGTQPGVQFRIAQQGLYQMNADTRGDLFVEMSVVIPKDLSPEQVNVIKSLIN
jgi:DnaJ-class molecular chaperone